MKTQASDLSGPTHPSCWGLMNAAHLLLLLLLLLLHICRAHYCNNVRLTKAFP
jgi:hypothetical protein